jgi:UDPglucose 6-dehydrogenase
MSHGEVLMAADVLVVGAGYVGLVTAVGLASLGHRIQLVETRADRLEALRGGRVPIHEEGLQAALDEARAADRIAITDRPSRPADVAMVCVGTPIDDDGRSDLSQLRSALASLGPILGAGAPLVIRSTLPPGGTRRAVEWAGIPSERVLTNPEFLRQGTALYDFLHPTRIVIGRFPGASRDTIDLVAGLFRGLSAPLLVVDVAAAELIKNGANAFLALKLSFTNEIAALAEEYGTDVDDVLNGITLDPRIGTQYMRPGLGFGGSCLPKELRAMAVAGAARGLPMHVTKAASDANADQQRRFAARVAAAVGGLDGRTIGLLGLAFKAGTDDVRDSPALGVARLLMAGRARVRAFDPEASGNAAHEVPGLEIVDRAEDVADGADAVVVATEWPAFRSIAWSKMRGRMRSPIVLDGRRLLDAAAMTALGYRYEAVGSAVRDTIVLPPDPTFSAPESR